ncbi:MAG: phosphonate ABC transporter, permease protein PhnE [Gemmatimonadota bacterium]|nr:phosphonate ABC transporter, permease protein PhnE [Gemmatimonadota bacterium]
MIAGLLSLILPGLGQAWAGRRYRGAVVFGAVLLAALVTYWYGVPAWHLAPAAIWLWNVWDAASLARGQERSAFGPVAAMLVMAYGIGWQVTQIDLASLTRNSGRAESILGPMLHPDFAVRREKTNTAWAPVEVPCGPHPPAATNTKDGATVTVAPDCGRLRDTLAVKATGLWPNTPTLVQWATPIGNRLALGAGFAAPLTVASGPDGTLEARIQIPPNALAAAPDPDLPLEHRVYLTQARAEPGFRLSENGRYVVEGIGQTLFLALMATTFGAIGAMLIAFPAARNLMSANWLTRSVYFVTRMVLNIVRSIEALIIAIVFVVIVGLGPFAGVIAITLHTIASLGKLYSEAIEGIDQGPLEAVRAAGGNWLQMVRYAVLPQIVPAFASFTLFRWDINVRTSTIIGFVGGGGIGFFLYQWIIKGDFRAVGSSFVAIALIVIVLDFVSARLRTRLV